MTTRLHLVPERRDKRGRRIGHNWWREYICDTLFMADHAWQLQRETVCIGYATEEAEYQELHPRPTLKAFLLANAGMNDREERTA